MHNSLPQPFPEVYAYGVDPEQASERGPSPAFSLAGVLRGVRMALFGASAGSMVTPQSMCAELERLRYQIEAIEDRFQAYRIEMQNLTTRVEDALALATSRYAKARGAEARANKEEPDDGLPDLVRDPEGYRAMLARGEIGG